MVFMLPSIGASLTSVLTALAIFAMVALAFTAAAFVFANDCECEAAHLTAPPTPILLTLDVEHADARMRTFVMLVLGEAVIS